jgi:hypothetical protein
MIKALMKLGIEGMYLNIIKAIYDKPIANIILNREKLKPFVLKSGRRQNCKLSPLLFNIVLEFLARAIRKKEKIKGKQIGKEEVKVSLFTEDMILYLKDKNFHPKHPRHPKQLSNVAGYKINLQRSVDFLYNNNEQIEKEYKKAIPFTIASKIIIYLRITLTKDINDLYKENYKPFKKEIEDYRRWKALP